MIRDLSASLQLLFDDPALGAGFSELLSANVVFTRPDAIGVPANTLLDLFLFSIRENTDLRSNERALTHQNGVVITTQPPRRIDCSYLITAWTLPPQAELKEHRLLSQALQVLGSFPTLPSQYLVGTLVGQEPPLPLLAPQPDGPARAAEFWSSMGIEMRASLTVTATLSMPALPDFESVPFTTGGARFDPGSAGSVETVSAIIAGEVRDAGGSPLAGAIVQIPGLEREERTDAEGRYSFAQVPPGAHQFDVVSVGYQPLSSVRAVPGPATAYQFVLTPLP